MTQTVYFNENSIYTTYMSVIMSKCYNKFCCRSIIVLLIIGKFCPVIVINVDMTFDNANLYQAFFL